MTLSKLMLSAVPSKDHCMLPAVLTGLAQVLRFCATEPTQRFETRTAPPCTTMQRCLTSRWSHLPQIVTLLSYVIQILEASLTGTDVSRVGLLQDGRQRTVAQCPLEGRRASAGCLIVLHRSGYVYDLQGMVCFPLVCIVS
jgi:hypothetical protein